MTDAVHGFPARCLRGLALKSTLLCACMFVLSACGSMSELLDGGPPDARAGDAGLVAGRDSGARDAAVDAGMQDAGMQGDAGPPPCPAYRERCGGECIAVSDDPGNCGGCGVACAEGEACFGPRCVADCPLDRRECGGRCADIRTDSAHCGACDVACGEGTGCADGNCHPAVAIDPSGVACEGGGPAVVFPGVEEGPRACAGELAETTFRWALCSCEGIDLFNPLRTDAFDSGAGPFTPDGLGAGVGTNGGFMSTSTIDVSGSLWAASPRTGISTSNATNVLQDVRTGGVLQVGNPFEVGQDAFVVGDLVTSSSVRIAGTLHQPPGSMIVGDVAYGALATEPVAVPDPCDCDARARIPVAAIVAAAVDENDNALVGLAPDALVVPGGPRRLDLPCGRYYVSAIDTNSPLTIAAHGRTALFIGGDVRSTAPLDIVVAPGAELDLLVGGGVEVSARLNIGPRDRPAAMRFYVGGVGTALELTNDAIVGGFVYVAEGTVTVSNPLEIFGGVFAGAFRNAGSTTIHYDRGVLRAGDACTPPPEPGGCTSCTECGNQACIEGACGACTSSAQCCAPLYCGLDGVCSLLE